MMLKSLFSNREFLFTWSWKKNMLTRSKPLVGLSQVAQEVLS